VRTLEVAKFSSFIKAAALILNDMNGLADLQGALLAVAGPVSSDSMRAYECPGFLRWVPSESAHR